MESNDLVRRSASIRRKDVLYSAAHFDSGAQPGIRLPWAVRARGPGRARGVRLRAALSANRPHCRSRELGYLGRKAGSRARPSARTWTC